MIAKLATLSLALTSLGLVGTASADSAYGRQCNRVLPKFAYGVFTGKRPFTSNSTALKYGSCNVRSAMVEDGQGAGLDITPDNSNLDLVDGNYVSGCIRLDFPLSAGWLLAAVDITAKPSPDACHIGTPCQGQYCGTGGVFSVFSAQYNEPWHLVKNVTVATKWWAEYKVLLPTPAPLVMVCRTGTGPARDDIEIDAAKGCAVQP